VLCGPHVGVRSFGAGAGACAASIDLRATSENAASRGYMIAIRPGLLVGLTWALAAQFCDRSHHRGGPATQKAPTLHKMYGTAHKFVRLSSTRKDLPQICSRRSYAPLPGARQGAPSTRGASPFLLEENNFIGTTRDRDDVRRGNSGRRP